MILEKKYFKSGKMKIIDFQLNQKKMNELLQMFRKLKLKIKIEIYLQRVIRKIIFLIESNHKTKQIQRKATHQVLDNIKQLILQKKLIKRSMQVDQLNLQKKINPRINQILVRKILRLIVPKYRNKKAMILINMHLKHKIILSNLKNKHLLSIQIDNRLTNKFHDEKSLYQKENLLFNSQREMIHYQNEIL